MQHLLTNKIASISEFRDPSKVIAKAGGKPVAILNRNNVVGYFVPAEAVEKISLTPASAEEIQTALNKRQRFIAPVLKYLEDK